MRLTHTTLTVIALLLALTGLPILLGSTQISGFTMGFCPT